jgi:hypothetical protein
MAQPIGIPGRELQRQDSAKGNAHHGRSFEALPVQEFGQIFNEVRQAEPPAQCEAIIFAAQLITYDAVVLS